MTLWRYILARFLRSTLGVFLVISLVVLLFSGVENLRKYADAGAKPGDIVTITLLQAPEVLYQVFPLVLMLASLVTFLGLARTSELVVMRASGISALRLLRVPVLAAVAIAIRSSPPRSGAGRRWRRTSAARRRACSRSRRRASGSGRRTRAGRR